MPPTAAPLHIGLNVLYLVPGAVGGIEIYAHELTAALAAASPDTRFSLFCGIEAARDFGRLRWPANVRIVRLPVRCAIKAVRVAAELTVLPFYAAAARVDVLHSLGTTSPLTSPAVRVVTVHDLIFRHFPRTFPPIAQRALSVLVPLGVRRCHRVIADSEATKQDLIESYGVAATKIDVVHPGFGMRAAGPATPGEALRARWNLATAPVVLTVAPALEHKNLVRLLDAFASACGLADPSIRPVLVIVGHPGRDSAAIQARAAAIGIADRVRLTGWIAAADLEGFYREARCFVYPSLLEGFGMPVLEAMARDVPVACSQAASLNEVAGDAALRFDPLDVDAMAGAIHRVLAEEPLRQALIANGRDQVRRFTWQSAAAATLATYRRALGRPAAGASRPPE